jgi:Domain of unknown function (DUF4266)
MRWHLEISIVTRAVVFAVFAVLAVGCTHVAPYEREYLARPGMDRKREALAEQFKAHVRDSREAATGNGASTGGGCGCN